MKTGPDRSFAAARRGAGRRFAKRGVGLKVLTGDVDTTTVTRRLVFGIFATLAEFERDLIHERTMAGLVAARARGRSGGRPRVMTKAKLKTAMTMMADRDNAARDVAVQLNSPCRRFTPMSMLKGNRVPVQPSCSASAPASLCQL